MHKLREDHLLDQFAGVYSKCYKVGEDACAVELRYVCILQRSALIIQDDRWRGLY